MELLGFIFYFLITLWVISFSYNIYYFFKNDDTELDTVFHNRTKTFEEAHIKLNILEKLAQKDLSRSRKILAKYEDNARRSRRKYGYYVSYIEPSLIIIYTGKLGGRFKRGWERLDKPVKYHLINIFIFLGLLAFLGVGLSIYQLSFFSIILLIILSIVILRLYNFLIKVNFLLFYILIDGILVIFKQDRGKLMKNIALLGLMTTGWFGTRRNHGAYVVGAAGVASYSNYSGGGSFGGFGGGSFGGGGAGGSW